MFRLIKYEIMGRYKSFFIMIVGLFLMSLIIMQKINGAIEVEDRSLWMTFSMILSIAAVAMIVIDGLRLLNRDLNSESGYSIFTLPIRAHSILFSKIIVTLVEVSLITIVAKYITTLTMKVPFGSIKQNLILLAIMLVLYIAALIVVYFAQTVGKLAINNIGYGRLITAATVILITYGGVYIDQYLSATYPKSIVFAVLNSGTRHSHPFSIEANIIALIFEVCVAILLFILTSYFLEKKIDI